MPGDLARHNCTHTHYTNVDPPLREHDTRNQFGAEVHRREVHHGVAEDGLLTGPGIRCSLRALALLELFPTFLSFSRSSRFVSECSSQDSGSFSLENTVWELLGTAELESAILPTLLGSSASICLLSRYCCLASAYISWVLYIFPASNPSNNYTHIVGMLAFSASNPFCLCTCMSRQCWQTC